MRRALFALYAFALAACLWGIGACKDEPKSTRWDQAASSGAKSAPSSTEVAKAGGSFNKFFPADGEGGTKRVFTQEKDGYAEAKFTQDGKELFTLSVSDVATNPEAKSKFEGATEKLSGNPVVTVGKNQTSVLVKDRFQVKVSSQTLDHEARKTWISKVDVAGLSAL